MIRVGIYNKNKDSKSTNEYACNLNSKKQAILKIILSFECWKSYILTKIHF